MRAVLTDIQRVVLQDSVRVTLSLDREVPYSDERIAGPDRVFFDLKGAQLAAPLVDKILSVLGRHRAADPYGPASERDGPRGTRPRRSRSLQRLHAL